MDLFDIPDPDKVDAVNAAMGERRILNLPSTNHHQQGTRNHPSSTFGATFSPSSALTATAAYIETRNRDSSSHSTSAVGLPAAHSVYNNNTPQQGTRTINTSSATTSTTPLNAVSVPFPLPLRPPQQQQRQHQPSFVVAGSFTPSSFGSSSGNTTTTTTTSNTTSPSSFARVSTAPTVPLMNSSHATTTITQPPPPTVPPPIKLRDGPQDARSFDQAFAFLRDSSGLGKRIDVVPAATATSASVLLPATTAIPGMKGFLGTSSSSSSSSSSSVPMQVSKLQLHVSPRQKGNPVLNYIKNVWWGYLENLQPDFVLGEKTAALYLSLKYHLLHPEYIQKRFRGFQGNISNCSSSSAQQDGQQQRQYNLKILLLLVDVEDCVKPLQELTKLCFSLKYTLICAFSVPEAARYLETYKAYEHKSAGAIQERVETTFLPRAQESLTTIRSVNKTDVIQLLAHFGSIADIMAASAPELQEPPGIGDKKARRLWEAFATPFVIEAEVGGGGKGGGDEGE